MTALDNLGARLQSLREAKDWSRRRLATEAGYARSYVAHLETGERLPSIEAAVLLAEVMGLPGHALLFDPRFDNAEADILPADAERITPVVGAVFDRGRHRMAGTNVRVDDVCGRFAAGDSIADLARDWEVGPELVEAALRTAIRSGARRV